MQTEDESGLRRLLEPGVIFLVAYLLLFAAMTRKPNFYDEGIMLTAAMRVAAGQVPHRDFYFIYGPAEIYILAGLFKSFGESLLVERLFDLAIKAVLVASVYSVVWSYCSRRIAGLISIVTLLWLWGLNIFGFATTPISLLNVVGSFLILPVFAGRASQRRLATAGAVSGLAALFRYDTGIALAGMHACIFAIAILLRFQGTTNRLRMFASALWPYLVGFLVVTVPPAIYYLSVAPVSALLHDVVLFPAKYYHNSRKLPFPGIHLKTLETLGIYLPIVIAGVAVWCLARWRSGAVATPISTSTPVGNAIRTAERQGFLITFTFLTVVMYLKGLVRVSTVHMYLATIPSLLVMALLLDERHEFTRPLRFALLGLMGLCLVPAGWVALHEIRQDQLWHNGMAQTFFRYHPPAAESEWCKTQNALTKGVCFLPEEDRVNTIEFLDSHTSPEQTLYSGLIHHDRSFANDNILYFATQRMPATRWSHFDPHLQNSYDIQSQMVHELERNGPPYIVLDAEFESWHEPNDSSKSSAVTLLDTYIRSAYQRSASFGTMSIWKKR